MREVPIHFSEKIVLAVRASLKLVNLFGFFLNESLDKMFDNVYKTITEDTKIINSIYSPSYKDINIFFPEYSKSYTGIQVKLFDRSGTKSFQTQRFICNKKTDSCTELKLKLDFLLIRQSSPKLTFLCTV